MTTFPGVLTSLMLSVSVCACGDGSSTREGAEQPSRRAEIQRLTTRLGSDPDNAALLRTLANEYWAVGELDQAQRTVERSLALQPNADAMLALTAMLYERGRYVEARSVMAGLGSSATPGWVGGLRLELDAVMAPQSGGQRSPELRRVGVGLVNSIDMAFVEVPGGSFVRGDVTGSSDTRPARDIQVGPYHIGKYEVTRRQFDQFRREVTYRFTPQPSKTLASDSSEHPVVGVSWENARAFTMWLSAREEAVYRLPTEAEWELAARGVNGYRNPWGDERGRAGVDGNWGRTSVADLQATIPPVSRVGSFARDRSPFGLFDMAGNASEWCLDEYDASYYAWSPAVNPFGPVKKVGVKVKRGGSWNDPSDSDFAIRRGSAGQNQTYTGNGFRVVLELNPVRRWPQSATQ